ncbi:LuxR C-terminal-related transcriptional regulator [Leucobacter sp. NPDC015123]|uniref:LuxR C-terminal-related transcriptional regulator n=1 Tax=Leucobacter sp. NPDC015123 TaxID=3364129 RepID=UPI0036F492CE
MGGSESQGRSATAWFFATPPDTRNGWMMRERLNLTLSHDIATHAAVIVEAPSGYGKTVALSLWARTQTSPTAWLTVSSHDTEAAQLLSGVLTALARVSPEVPPLSTLLRRLQDGDILAQPAVVELLELVLSDFPDTVLVIDDAHLTSATAFEAVILPLIAHGRGRLRLIVAASRDIRTWCARELAHGSATIIDAQRLSFTADELEELATQFAGPQGESLQAADLWDETQGWPVAVQFALQSGIAYPKHESAETETITRYVESAVLGGLDESLRDFIVAATTCGRLTGDLAQHLTGCSDAAALLEECHSLGLFLDRFQHATSTTVYRWHSAFARHCQAIQARNNPSGYSKLHRRAAEWLSTRYPAEAVNHALASHDPEYGLQIVEQNWLQLITGGQAGTLNSACAQFPAPWDSVPSLQLIRACVLDVFGDRHSAEMLAAQARSALRQNPPDPQALAHSTAAFADLFLIHEQTGLQTAVEHAHALLTSAPMTTSQYLHGVFLVGWSSMRLRSNPSRAISLLASAASGARDAGHAVLADRATANLSLALAVGGRLAEAQSTLEQLLSVQNLIEWEYYDGGIDVMAAVLIAFWRNDLDAVVRLGRELHAHGGHDSSYAALARVHFAFAAARLHDNSLIDEAAKMLREISSSEKHGVPWPAYRRIGAAHLAMARGDEEGALRELESIVDWQSIPTTLVLAAELYRRLGKHDQVMAMLGGITKQEVVSYTYASAQFTQAAVAWSRRDRATAHQRLERSLAVAAREGIIAPFVDLDDIGRELLTEHSSWGTEFESFIAARLAYRPSGGTQDSPAPSQLSLREREIFSYLATTMTAEEIAAELHVSVNTVRSHQRSIYRKLGVNTRREAVRAHKLNR